MPGMFHNSWGPLQTVPETRYRVNCPGEIAEMKRKHNESSIDDSTNPKPERRIVAHMCFSLYDDDECIISTSESVTNCDRGPVVERMKQQLIDEHKEFVMETAQSNGKVKATEQPWRMCRTAGKARESSWSTEHASILSNKKKSKICSKSAATSYTDTNKAKKVIVSDTLIQQDDDAECDDQVSEDDCRPVLIEGKVNSIVIQDSDEVVKHMTTILKNMQQTAVKRLAKAWIKGICPKKQAKFPYHNCKTLPKWWPDISVCPFTEPDHIRKEQRLQLCLHLLRLRPLPNDLQAWNDNDNAPHKSHILKGWTEFLREVAPPETLMDIRQSDADNTSKRYNHLASLYDIARVEEAYMNGEIDGETTFQWTEPSLLRRKNKSSVRPSASAKRPHEKVELADESEQEDSSRRKGRKRRSIKSSPAMGFTDAKEDSKTSTPATTTTAHTSPAVNKSVLAKTSTAPASMPAASSLGIQPFHYVNTCGPAIVPYTSQEMAMDAYKPVSVTPIDGCLPNGSFDSSFSSNYSSMYHPSTATPFIPEAGHGVLHNDTNIHHALACLGFKHEQEQLCMNTSEVPQPYFATVPNSPVLPQSGDLSSSLHDNFHSVPMRNTTFPNWTLSTRYHPAFSPLMSAFDTVPQHMYSEGPSHGRPSATHFDGVRTIVNSPIEMSSSEQLGPRTLSGHSAFRPSQF